MFSVHLLHDEFTLWQAEFILLYGDFVPENPTLSDDTGHADGVLFLWVSQLAFVASVAMSVTRYCTHLEIVFDVWLCVCIVRAIALVCRNSVTMWASCCWKNQTCNQSRHQWLFVATYMARYIWCVLDNSPTDQLAVSHVAYWSTHGLVNPPMEKF